MATETATKMTVGRALDVAEAPHMFNTATVQDAHERLTSANETNEYGTAWAEYFTYKLEALATHLA